MSMRSKSIQSERNRSKTNRFKSSRSKQTSLFKKGESPYGGILRNTRKGRAGGRPLSTRHSMHLTLRSSKAKGEYSFATKKNSAIVAEVLKRFSAKYGVRLIQVANVGNHLHLHLKLGLRRLYSPFIRAITAAIAVKVTGASRINRLEDRGIKHFWDYRPHTRFVIGLRDWVGVQDYVEINKLEGLGYGRVAAQALVWMSRERWSLNQAGSG